MNCSAIIRLAKNPKMKMGLESCLSFSFDTIGVRLFTGIWFFTLIFLGEGFLGSSMLAQGTAFLYQGRLNDGGQAANGFYDLQFAVFDAATNGNQVSPVLTNLDTYLTNGYFQTALDFGNIFEGDSRWLQIGVRTNGTGSFALLQPLQQIMAVPYAQFAGRASNLVGVLPSSQLSGTLNLSQIPSSLTTNAATGISLAGLLSGNGAGLTNLSGQQITGPLTVQNGVALTIETNPPSATVFSTNFFSLSEYSGFPELMGSFTNSSYVAIYSGFPSNTLAFGSQPSLISYSSIHSSGYQASFPHLRLHFRILGSQFSLFMQDGQFEYATDPLPQTSFQWQSIVEPNVGNPMLYIFNFSQYAVHDVWISIYQGYLDSILIPATNSFLNVLQPTLTGIVVGDSISDGTGGATSSGAAAPYKGYVEDLQDYLNPFGINLADQSEGGTGYVNTNLYNGGPLVFGVPFLQRLTNNIAAFNPQFVIWAGGINDNVSNNTLFSAATNCYGSLKALLPNCKQLVIAPWGDMTSPADETNKDAVISNAAAVFGLPIIFPDYSTSSSWITGNYATPGSGNAPLYWSGNGPHPNNLGHSFYAAMVQNFILTNLLTKGAPALW